MQKMLQLVEDVTPVSLDAILENLDKRVTTKPKLVILKESVDTRLAYALYGSYHLNLRVSDERVFRGRLDGSLVEVNLDKRYVRQDFSWKGEGDMSFKPTHARGSLQRLMELVECCFDSDAREDELLRVVNEYSSLTSQPMVFPHWVLYGGDVTYSTTIFPATLLVKLKAGRELDVSYTLELPRA